jgi:hypothetical protein
VRRTKKIRICPSIGKILVDLHLFVEDGATHALFFKRISAHFRADILLAGTILE